ncbi:hypothetical protein EU803_06055 [Loktanella sp. IMCC34160]|uniref:hypothetical protein n=1 Tax=Loktanella sp. IMCC34160 TaxID=2510646 RepID=UPI00101DA5A0|nr:hypothetical protein [Loktanella sp. IMCC34160]RYG92013.1 hypothetical protein EU803_06055 [Loktanella sp. IMCC34160]
MKKFAISAFALIGSAGAALAGGMAEPVMEMAPVIVEEQAGSSSSAGLIIPLILIALIAAAMSSSSESTNIN